MARDLKAEVDALKRQRIGNYTEAQKEELKRQRDAKIADKAKIREAGGSTSTLISPIVEPSERVPKNAGLASDNPQLPVDQTSSSKDPEPSESEVETKFDPTLNVNRVPPYIGLKSAKKSKRKLEPSGSTTPEELPGSANGGEAEASSTEHAAKRPARRPKPEYELIQNVNTRTTTQSSEWYNNIDMKAKCSREDLASLQYVKTLIRDSQKPMGLGDREKQFMLIRRLLHKMDLYDFLTPVLVKKSKVLEEDVGLPVIFDDTPNIGFPWDVKADSRALYSKWLRGNLDPHLLRGIDSSRKKRVNGAATSIGHSLLPGYPGRVSCNVVGSNNLQNGQWWPMQICAMRDGAHGEIEAGIHGRPERGAFSVILSSGDYEDRDNGDEILYCGTAGALGKPSGGTKYLLESHRLHNPLRVLRSSALPKSNKYRPAKGIRYDGLYDIEGFEILNPKTEMHRFALRRCPGQDPIRHEGVEARPTNEELDAYQTIRGLLGIGA